jgi:hypothetical protein
MALVARWLEADAPEDGGLSLRVQDAAAEMGLPEERGSILSVLAALGELESRGLVAVEWPAGPTGEAHVTLSSELRRDAERLFGRR